MGVDKITFSRIEGMKEYLQDVLNENVAPDEKIKLLLSLKTVIEFEILQDGINATLSQTKDEMEHDGLDDVITKKLQYQELKEGIEFSIIELAGNVRNDAPKNKNKPLTTNLNAGDLALLFNLLNSRGIITGDKTKIAMTMNQLTGLSFNHIENTLGRSFNKSAKNKYTDDNVRNIYNCLTELIKEVEPHLKKG